MTRPHLAGYRIGVRYQSVHHAWAQTELVETGFANQSDLIILREIDKSVGDVRQGLVDSAIANLPPAQIAIQSGGLAITGQGLNRQRFGIAIPNDPAALKTRLNQVLNALLAKGRIEELATEYLELDEKDLIPVLTPDPAQPTPTSVPTASPPACIDGMQQESTFLAALESAATFEITEGQLKIKTAPGDRQSLRRLW